MVELYVVFFEDALKEANSHLMEGDDRRRVVKKDWGMEPMYEIMGTMVAHSVLLGGPGLPCLSPCMYQYMCGHSDACYPTIDDIPLNLAIYDHQIHSKGTSCYVLVPVVRSSSCL